MGPRARFSSSSLTTPVSCSLLPPGICSLSPVGFGPRFQALFTPELLCRGIDSWGPESRSMAEDGWDPSVGGLPCQACRAFPFRVLPHLRCEDPCPLGTFGEGCSSTCPTCVQGTCDAMTGECVCDAGYWGPR